MTGDQRTVSAHLALKIGDGTMDMDVEVPLGPARPASLVPLAHAIAEAAAEVASDRSVAEGRPISCKKGCGACCRQIVPVAESEARHVAALVAAMPEPRRSQVLARFEDLRRRLEEAGLLERVRDVGSLPTPALRWELGRAYFQLGIACPFLEDESCSIHPDRPSRCREYLVTSPAEGCRTPSAETVERIMVSTRVSRALFGLGRSPEDTTPLWVPLSLVPEWVESHPEPPPTRTGEQLLREFLGRLSDGRARERKPPAPSGENAAPPPA